MSTPVVLVHDAAIDEYMAMALLTTMPDVDLVGVVIVNADCIAVPALQTQWKVMQYLKQEGIPFGLSSARAVNAFPWSYRSDCVAMGSIPVLADLPDHGGWPPYPNGELVLAAAIANSSTPVTLLVTSPMTTVANVVGTNPDLMANVSQLIWMGGAINVAGNLDPSTVPTPPWNPKAEWNCFWDPYAVSWMLQVAPFPIRIFPLDISNTAPITPAFLSSLKQQGSQYPYSSLAYEAYDIVVQRNETFYRLWDVTTAAWLGAPDLFAPPTTMPLVVEADFGGNQGWLHQPVLGQPKFEVYIDWADGPDALYDYVLAQFQR